MEKQRKQKRLRGFKKFKVNVSDFFTLICTLVFALYLLTLAESESSISWIHYSFLAITLLFVLFFAIKIFFLNKYVTSIDESRKLKYGVRALKYLFKLFMMAVIIMGLISIVSFNMSGFMIVFSTILANLVFILLLVWDTVWLVRNRRRMKGK